MPSFHFLGCKLKLYNNVGNSTSHSVVCVCLGIAWLGSGQRFAGQSNETGGRTQTWTGLGIEGWRHW